MSKILNLNGMEYNIYSRLLVYKVFSRCSMLSFGHLKVTKPITVVKCPENYLMYKEDFDNFNFLHGLILLLIGFASFLSAQQKLHHKQHAVHS